MKKFIFTTLLLALAACQVPTASAYGHGGGWGRGGWGRGGFGWGVGVGVLGGLAVGATYARPYYYDPYYYGPRPYWNTGFYSSGYYYPQDYSSYYAAAPAPVAQPQPAPQNVTINNNYYNAPSTPMSGANSLFGR